MFFSDCSKPFLDWRKKIGQTAAERQYISGKTELNVSSQLSSSPLRPEAQQSPAYMGTVARDPGRKRQKRGTHSPEAGEGSLDRGGMCVCVLTCV